MKKTILTLLFVFLSLSIFPQTGSIQGTVLDQKTKETLIGATIILEGTTTGTTTGIDGRFSFTNIKSGKYSIRASYISYNSKIFPVIVKNESLNINFELEENSVALQGVTVTAIKKNNTEVSTINNIKSAPVVVSGISSQLINKTQDKDASEVVKRLPGVSVVDDKFIIIRGLSSRYNNVWINNSTAPSSEPDTRSFSFDIIPSSIIDNILIYKSPMAELPSDYSGGFIKISTIGIPSQNSTSVSYETSINQYTTFNEFNKETDNTWEPTSVTGIPNQKLSFSLNRKWEKGKSTFGSVTSLSYSYSNKHYDDVINNNYSIYDFKNDKPSFNDQFVDNYYKNTDKLSLLQNFTYYPENNLKMDFKNFINNIGQSSSSNRYGREWYNDGRYNKSTELTHNNRFMYTGQLGAEKKSENSIMDLTLGYSSSIKSDPDIRRYRYISDDDNTYIIMFGSNPDLSSLSQMNLDLHENILSSAFNYTRNFTKNFNNEFSIYRLSIRTFY
jgi:outer membrane receptor for ferrienterochelin and colicin